MPPRAAKHKPAKEHMPYLKKYLGPPWASTARPALIMVGREAAVHIMFVLMTSSGVVAAAAKAPAHAPMAKSSCTGQDQWSELERNSTNGQQNIHVDCGLQSAHEC